MRRLPLFKIARRNVWRNKRRTAITVAALASAAGFIVWFSAFGEGFGEKTAEDIVRSGLGHVVVEPAGFEKNPQVEKFLRSPREVERLVEGRPRVQAWSPRVEMRGLASSPENSMGAVIYGVDPRREPRISILPRRLAEGEFFREGEERGVILGYKMAEVLGVELGDMVGVMVQNVDGEVAAEAYELVGLLRMGNPAFDNGAVLLPLSQTQHLLGYEEGYNKIVILAESRADVETIRDGLAAEVPPGVDVLAWFEVSPQAFQYYGIMVGLLIFILLLLIVLASFGMTNTILMSVLERVNEFGVMAALGLRPFQVFRVILYEATVLSALGIAVGLLGGGLASWINTVYGADLGAWSGSVGVMGFIDPVVPFVMRPAHFVLGAVTVFFIATVSAIYPGVKAARLRPVVAMRRV
ncbi:MAG: FtsX-like permease family protein [candidate division Zixibacteria bacterium]|nr:FtsX-like permease family protein [candidate division Zixibacteria bacterium]